MSGQQHAQAALYPRERPGTHCTGGWVGPRAGLDSCGKSRPHRDSIPARSQSLYRLSYRAHKAFCTKSNCFLNRLFKLALKFIDWLIYLRCHICLYILSQGLPTECHYSLYLQGTEIYPHISCLMWNKKPTRCHLVLYLFLLYKLLFLSCSTCFGPPCAHLQELTT